MRAAASTTGTGATASRDGNNISPDFVQTGPYVESATIGGATSGMSSSSLGSGSGYFDTVARMIGASICTNRMRPKPRPAAGAADRGGVWIV
jgi:hypothetical protein